MFDMQEVIVKAKLINSIDRRDYGKDWAVGYFHYKWSAFYEKFIPTVQHITHPNFKLTNCAAFFYFEIDPDTLCHFTGKHDINNEPIFTNDVLSSGDEGNIMYVAFKNGFFYAVDKNERWESLPSEILNYGGRLEIVGNVHDETKECI